MWFSILDISKSLVFFGPEENTNRIVSYTWKNQDAKITVITTGCGWECKY